MTLVDSSDLRAIATNANGIADCDPTSSLSVPKDRACTPGKRKECRTTLVDPTSEVFVYIIFENDQKFNIGSRGPFGTVVMRLTRMSAMGMRRSAVRFRYSHLVFPSDPIC